MANSRKTQLPDLSARVEACLSRHFLPDQPVRICIGLSGGLDSIVLLHIIANLRVRWTCDVFAVHIHHGLSPNADRWGDFVRQAAADLNLPCEVVRVDVDQREALGLEAAARVARYAVFERQNCDFLLLAQHQDDQAETVFLNLLRGSGVRGLAAMPECRLLEGGVLVLRPLLNSRRMELQAYAQAHALRWVEDESNADQSLSRNFLRHSVFPSLNAVFPGVSVALARSAAHMAEADAVLTEVAQMDLQACCVDDAFDLVSAAQLSPLRARNAIRYWLNRAGVVPDARAFDELLRMMSDAQPDVVPVWTWREHAVRRYRGALHVTPVRFKCGTPTLCAWQDGADMVLPAWGGVLCWEKVAGLAGIGEEFLRRDLVLRPRAGGERLRVHAQGPNRTLKNLYQESGILPWLRDSTPILWVDGRVAAVPGLWVGAEFSVPDGWQASWRLTGDVSGA